MSYVCPKCLNDHGLWRGVDVPGWESIDGNLKPLTRGSLDREAHWSNAEADGTYGCGECNWEGGKADLVRLGLDGLPLPKIHPGQERLV